MTRTGQLSCPNDVGLCHTGWSNTGGTDELNIFSAFVMSPSHAAEITCTNEGEVPCVLSGMGDRQILAVSDIAFASLDTYTEADVAAANPGGEDGDEFRRERRAAAKHPRRRLSDSATPELIRLSYLTFAESRWPQAFSCVQRAL